MKALVLFRIHRMMDKELIIRPAHGKDTSNLLQLMIQLAEFEGYIDHFKVTENELDRRLFEQQDFNVIVAEKGQSLVGMLVYYYLPFSYDLKPWVYIKELFVDSKSRSLGIGKQLMMALAKECVQQECTKIRWDVLASNAQARSFYRSLGAKNEESWQLFSLGQSQIIELSQMSADMNFRS